MPTKAALLLELVGPQVVAYLRSLTDGNTSLLRHRGKQERTVVFNARDGGQVSFQAYRQTRRHPGGWGDITGALANAYAWKVERTSDGAMLTFENNMEYAVHLEARDGYFVLSGITDPGGPVEQELVRLVGQVAPEWEVRFG